PDHQPVRNARQNRRLPRSRSGLQPDSARRLGPPVGNKFFVSRRRRGRNNQSARPLERAPDARRCRRHRSDRGRVPAGKWLRTVAARRRASPGLAAFVDARNVSRVSRQQAVAEVAYAGRPVCQYVCAGTRRRTGAGVRIRPILRGRAEDGHYPGKQKCDSMSDSISNRTSAARNPSNLREEVFSLIAQGSFDLASRRLAELWRRDPAPATASFVTARLDELREKTRDQLALTKFKLAILRSFTVEPIVP